MKKILIILIPIFVISAFSCGQKKEKNSGDDIYSCSMHPQVIEHAPGLCPICQMDLTKVNVGAQTNEGAIQLGDDQIHLANIITDTVKIQNLINEIKLSAVVSVNQNKTWSVSSRITGRIEKLYYKSVGELIKKDQPIYDIYSEQLIITQKDYLIAILQLKNLSENNLNYIQLAEASRQKLLLFGVSDKQLKDIELKGEVSDLLTVHAQNSGVITEILITQGDYVMDGNIIYKITDLSSLWVEAQLYPAESNLLSDINDAEITFPSLPDVKLIEKIEFVNPELLPGSKLVIARILIQNPEGKIIPGMQAFISIRGNVKKVLAVPVTAVIHDPQGETIWIKNKDGAFQPRMVIIGEQNQDFIEIVSGLQEGEIVVISGTYLLQSEYIFKKGTDPMSGMKM